MKLARYVHSTSTSVLKKNILMFAQKGWKQENLIYCPLRIESVWC